VQSTQLGGAETDVDSANRYADPQVGQTTSDIFMASLQVWALFNESQIVLNQCGTSKEAAAERELRTH
jgi:hypothetical protein